MMHARSDGSQHSGRLALLRRMGRETVREATVEPGNLAEVTAELGIVARAAGDALNDGAGSWTAAGNL